MDVLSQTRLVFEPPITTCDVARVLQLCILCHRSHGKRTTASVETGQKQLCEGSEKNWGNGDETPSLRARARKDRA